MDVSPTVFEIFTLKARKWLIFPTSPLFEAPAWGNPSEFCDEIWRQKTRIVGLPDGGEIMTLAFFVLTQYRRVTDRQTDRWTDRGQTDGHVAVAKTRARLARVKPSSNSTQSLGLGHQSLDNSVSTNSSQCVVFLMAYYSVQYTQSNMFRRLAQSVLHQRSHRP